uniref:(northern house mosquito) hypothetical protein n=1 Tax=Culex pipiens TaxID=7175 RepID=A0A8D8B296_CULPI
MTNYNRRQFSDKSRFHSPCTSQYQRQCWKPLQPRTNLRNTATPWVDPTLLAPSYQTLNCQVPANLQPPQLLPQESLRLAPLSISPRSPYRLRQLQNYTFDTHPGR